MATRRSKIGRQMILYGFGVVALFVYWGAMIASGSFFQRESEKQKLQLAIGELTRTPPPISTILTSGPSTRQNLEPLKVLSRSCPQVLRFAEWFTASLCHQQPGPAWPIQVEASHHPDAWVA